jgi:hypothetical protein
MKINIESTDKIVSLLGPLGEVPARIWEGFTDSGIAVHCFITRIAVHKDDDSTQFERELQEQHAPSSLNGVYPSRLVL